MAEEGWGLIVAEVSSFGSALRGLVGDELVFAVILHSVQKSFPGTRSRSMSIVIPSLAKLNQDVHDSHLNASFSLTRFKPIGFVAFSFPEQVFSCSSTVLKSRC